MAGFLPLRLPVPPGFALPERRAVLLRLPLVPRAAVAPALDPARAEPRAADAPPRPLPPEPLRATPLLLALGGAVGSLTSGGSPL